MFVPLLKIPGTGIIQEVAQSGAKSLPMSIKQEHRYEGKAGFIEIDKIFENGSQETSLAFTLKLQT